MHTTPNMTLINQLAGNVSTTPTDREAARALMNACRRFVQAPRDEEKDEDRRAAIVHATAELLAEFGLVEYVEPLHQAAEDEFNVEEA